MSGSLLDMLRQRTTGNMQDEALRRASEFGAGMLASGSPNFFAMLGAGARAQAEGERSRMDELRRLAEAERQQRMTDIEEQRRRDEAANRQAQLRLDEQRVAQGNRPQFQFMRGEDGTSVVAVDVLDPTRRIPVPGTLLPGDRTGREELRMRQTARDQAQRAADEEARRRQAIGQTMTADELKNWRDAAERRNLESVGLMPLQGGTAAPASTAPAPSQVLQYGGPRISPQRQQ